MTTTTNPAYTYIGKNLPRQGVEQRVTGAPIYAVDLEISGAIHGGILHSTYAHAKILSIDTSAAEVIPGVRAVVTGQDIPDVRYGRSLGDRYILARDRVLFLGDAVAAVAADSLSLVHEALSKIKVTYEPLPVVIDPEEAMGLDAPALHPEIPQPATLPKDANFKNVCGHTTVHVGDPDAAMAAADFVVEETYESQAVHAQYLEPRSCVADYDDNGRLTVWNDVQSPFTVRRELAAVLRIPISKVRLIVSDIGGGFGAKSAGIGAGGSLEAICSLLAMKTGRPVKMVLDKAEETAATSVRSPARVWIQTGVNKDGTIVARRARMVYDVGGYSGQGVLAGGTSAQMLSGWYRIPNIHIDGYAVYTNKQMCGAVRGPGGPQATFAVECHMDAIAAKLGMGPVEFRLKNIPASGERDFRGHLLRDIALGECLKRAAERIGWGTVTLAENQGIGFACSTWGHGAGLGHGAIVKINEDGSATVLVGKVDYGTGVRLAIPMIVAEELGMPFGSVTMANVDTDTSPWDFGTVGSRTTVASGEATRLAAIDARNQLFEIAAKQLGAGVGELEAKERQIRVVGQPERMLPLAAVATQAHFSIGEVIGRGYFNGEMISAHEEAQGESPTYAAHAALVEVDPDTGTVKVLRYVAVQDVGIAIHPDGVEGQIEGGVVQGLGQALCEQVLVDSSGRTLNPTFVDYLLPTANIVPPIESIIVEGYLSHGPYGAKGVGELPCLPPPATVANAIANASGVRVRKLPLSPENVLRSVRELADAK